MSKSLINEAVLTQVLNHLRNGQLRRCAEMGLRPEILAQLQQPAVMSILTNTPVSWVDVRVNIDVMEKILATAERSAQEDLQIERALKLGATTTMIQSFFGLSPEDTATKRLMLEIHPRRGRWRQLDEQIERQIWFRWEHLMHENQVRLEDSMELLDIAMILTEEINAGIEQDSPEFISLAIVWSLIQSWLKDGLYPSGKSSQSQAGLQKSQSTLYLASVSSHLPHSAPSATTQVNAETDRQQLLNLVQSEGDTAP
ncbi:DUF2857 domain-containing protein [Pseudomonas aeruginosa]|uniref:DUF2857 domain-containing protein n=1 Tax=Pseudomonas aeruginosa TaxID=287 RepID=UPI0011B7392D|nr:DUF2857 domain-containing protein [Pseudomonas aeruginosa]EKV6492030.1 DUF2857 domain-containing protein [Pseudomonas aeruginosa]TWW48479.1 DUF2857 domain-containing protein [Pseudomonas aeruginosa]TWY05451.1 DUF2857 domain-containing protein [Pseudomonas aeruginosa]